MDNPLTDALPPKVRKYAYVALAIASFGWSAYQTSNGDWGQVVAGILAGLTGSLAASNTNGKAA